jgi:hypothetical protein
MNNELERILKEAVVAYSKVLSRHSPGETEKMTRNLSQDFRYLDRDLNSKPPKYEGVLTTRPQNSVKICP